MKENFKCDFVFSFLILCYWCIIKSKIMLFEVILVFMFKIIEMKLLCLVWFLFFFVE